MLEVRSEEPGRRTRGMFGVLPYVPKRPTHWACTRHTESPANFMGVGTDRLEPRHSLRR